MRYLFYAKYKNSENALKLMLNVLYEEQIVCKNVLPIEHLRIFIWKQAFCEYSSKGTLTYTLAVISNPALCEFLSIEGDIVEECAQRTFSGIHRYISAKVAIISQLPKKMNKIMPRFSKD